MTNLNWIITNAQLDGIFVNSPPLKRLVRGGFVVLDVVKMRARKRAAIYVWFVYVCLVAGLSKISPLSGVVKMRG